MRLAELFIAVKEEGLDKDKLESYYQQLTYLSAQMELSIADLEKEAAVFLEASLEETDAAKNRKWRATASGQNLITLKRQVKATDKMRASVKTRLYQIY